MILKIHKCNKCNFGRVARQKKVVSIKSNDHCWHFSFSTEWQLPPAALWLLYLIVSWVWAHMVGSGCSRFSIWKNENALIRVEKASMHERSVRCTVCLNAISVSVSVDVCACAHVCLYDGGGGRAGIKHTRSTSQRLGGPSPALVATHVNPTTQKIGQWNTTLSHTETHTRRYTHMHQYQLKESQSASRASALSPVCDPRSTLPRTPSCRTDTSSGLEQQD